MFSNPGSRIGRSRNIVQNGLSVFAQSTGLVVNAPLGYNTNLTSYYVGNSLKAYITSTGIGYCHFQD